MTERLVAALFACLGAACAFATAWGIAETLQAGVPVPLAFAVGVPFLVLSGYLILAARWFFIGNRGKERRALKRVCLLLSFLIWAGMSEEIRKWHVAPSGPPHADRWEQMCVFGTLLIAVLLYAWLAGLVDLLYRGRADQIR